MRLIDADALIDNLELMYEHRDSKDEPYNIGVRGAINMTRKAPTIEPKRGEWIRSSDIDIAWGSKVYTCSNCEHKRNSKANFCPMCGAEMK